MLLAVAVAVWIARRLGLLASRPPAAPADSGAAVFRARFAEGQLVEAEGVLPAPLRVALSEVAERESLTGEIRWEGADRLRFSSTIPPGTRQRLRNVLLATR
jgi:hypothetical protein